MRINHKVRKYLVRLSMDARLICVQYGGNAAEHLKDKRFPVHEIELFYSVLDGSCDQFVRLMGGI